MKGLSFLVILAIFQQISALIDLQLIASYLKEKSTKHVTILGCYDRKERFILAKTLMSQTRMALVFNINQAGIYSSLKSRHAHVGMILDGDCLQVEKFLITCGQLKYFDVKYHWLVIASTINVMQYFENVSLNINVDVHVAVPNGTTSNWTIFDIYNPAFGHGGALNITEIGFYSKKLGYTIERCKSKYLNRKNMTGVSFTSLVVLPVPFEGKLEDYLNSDDNRNINTFNRFHSRLVNFCTEFYNFSLHVQKVDSWGYTNPDGTFDGMVGALERKTIDFGSSPLFLREDRARVIDYGRNTWILRAAFIFRNPKTHTSIEIFLHPLPTSVWIITGLLAVISIIILKIVTTFERKMYKQHVETSWSVSVLFTVAAFCQQGSPATPKMTCGRITTIFIFLLSVLIYQFYSASLVSHLLMKPPTKIENIKDILESSLKAGCEDILYDRDYFKHTTDEVAKELYNRKILGKRNTSNFFTPEYGLKLVERGEYAFHVETATAYPIIEVTFTDKAICDLREIQLFRTQPMYANYQKGSPFRDMMDVCFQRIAEQGLLFRERRHWHPRKPECIQSSRSLNFHVGLDEFYPALVVFLIGIICSLIILVIEMQFIFVGKPAPPPKLESTQTNVFPFVN